MFAASISSKSRAKGDQAPKSSFAERFGTPAQSQAQEQDSQTLFPTWPGLQSTHTSPPVSPLSIRPPPSNFVAAEKYTTGDGKQTAGAPTTRRYQQVAKRTQPSNKKRELFSDRIGNASSFVNTSSFEAKVAMEPAAHTFSRWMVAAKNNIERFKTLPEPAEHTFEPPSTGLKGAVNPSVSSTARNDSLLESSPKSFSRTSRNPSIVPSSRRMLSTSTTDVSVYSSLTGQVGDPTRVVEAKKPSACSYFWKLCAVWMVAVVSEVRSRPQPAMSGIMRRLCANQHRPPFPNSSLSFFQPAFHPSLLILSRGYATTRKRVLKRRAHNRRDTSISHRYKRQPASTRKQRRDEIERLSSQHPPKKPPFIHQVSSDTDAPYILIPSPATRTELCNALRYLIQSTELPPSLPQLIATHNQYPTLQTAESYNILLAHASRVAPTPYSSQIISRLRASRVVWDKRTEQLVVRAHIQSRRWEKAIQLAEKLWMDGATSRTPLNIFAELLHFVLTKKTTEEDTAKMADRCWKLFPTGVTVDVIGQSPRIAYNIVRLLVNTGRHEKALQLSRRLLESLESPTPSNVRYCRSILFHVIRPPRGRPSAHLFKDRRQLFDSLLQHNSSLGLTPDPELTCALLQNLRKRRNRGAAAFHALLELRAKYGPQVENSAVRRLITRYAIDDENFDLARNMFKRESLARLENSKQLRPSQPEPEVPWVGEDALPTQSHLEYLRNKGTENRKFTTTARSLRRRESKLGRKEQIHPRTILAAKARARRWENMRPRRKQRIITQAVSLTSSNNEQKGT
ncbi:hypothetical protein RSOLAG1IB_00776 [Rhizoctonia solani AG-1 IB]|uniref:Uncharacterized protein n=1 Tax=Thanatephorus cucumeris (strain AG1-IB / isolate 7/3/14) TaxID=1108050 RepID=A0A0B7F7M6_THACB|nr:hypothetical protein RSOLAG1IB_00776 [Rhizoctonia solani AG-1 IB]